MSTPLKHSSNLTNPRPNPAKKKRRSSVNWKQVVIIGALALALISMILPNLIGLFGALFAGGPSEAATAPSTPSNSTTPSTTTMPEPTFAKEGELTFVSAEGKDIARIDIEKAENDSERAMGLMFRRSMLPNQGMLFLFDRNEPQSFWMRNTFISLDILFVDDKNVITTIHQNTATETDAPLPSNGNAQYVVEVIGGFCSTHGIKVGDKISWQ